jgi:N-acetylmuramoyl-L-alanine amidase
LVPALLAAAAAVAPPPAPSEVLTLSRDLRVRLESGRELVLEARPWPGESHKAFALRLAATPVKADLLTAALDDPGALTEDGYLRVKLAQLSDDVRAVVLRNVFPQDGPDGADWVHVARVGALPVYDEGLWQVALWFTGSGEHFQEIEAANGLDSPELSAGQRVRIPAALLDPALRSAPTSDDGSLEYGSDARGEFAGYRLKSGEALYSAVVLRFTGRTAPDDVEALARTIAARSAVKDLTDIPVGWLVKIPRDVLEPEFLPRSDSRRKSIDKEAAAMERELAERPPPEPKRGLEGVVVIVDPGHGGLDPGTMNHGVWEHDYVFDVATRLKRELLSKTRATVYLTLDDATGGDVPSSTDALAPNHRRTVMTTPPFLADAGNETAVAVNLRWYLANSLYRKAQRSGIDPDRVVFVSLHADARHPSSRGVMVYVPGARYREGTLGSDSASYRRFKEVREQPQISFPRRDRLRSEGVSRKLADAIVREFRREDLPVQPYQPVREKVIRGRGVWLPAVLKGNSVPAKVLVEMVNLNNTDDAALLGRAADRERLAEALASGLSGYFGRKPPSGASRAGAATRLERGKAERRVP